MKIYFFVIYHIGKSCLKLKLPKGWVFLLELLKVAYILLNKISKGFIHTRIGNNITKTGDNEIIDIVGCFKVEIGKKSFDTVCVMELGNFNNAIAIEQYIDENGRTILWRRFNRDDWAIKRYKKKWSEQLPNNEQLIINGETFVHWYDCITDYIL